MKTLQNNFTTPEQSKRLLELGVPADSADCYINTNGNTINVIPEDSPKYSEYCRSLTYLVPCWSAGRLMEIYELCNAQEFIRDVGTPLMEDVLSAIYNAVNDTTEQWDFSKLEEWV